MLVNESRQGRARARIGQGLGPQGTGRVAGRGGGARGGGRQARKASGSPPRTGPFLEGVQGFVARRTCFGGGTVAPMACEEAGRRIGSLCAIEVKGLKRRPPTAGGRPMP